MTKFFRSFLRNESGATAIEYGLIAAVLGLGILTGAKTLRNAVSDQFTQVGTDLKAIKN